MIDGGIKPKKGIVMTAEKLVAGPLRGAPFRKVVEWLHYKIAAAQNLPYEEGDVCLECADAVRDELRPLMAEALASLPSSPPCEALITQWRENVQYCLKESDRLANVQEDLRSERFLTRGRTIEECAYQLERALASPVQGVQAGGDMPIPVFAAELYQICGALGAPAPVLDQLSAAARGVPLPYTTLLPFPDRFKANAQAGQRAEGAEAGDFDAKEMAIDTIRHGRTNEPHDTWDRDYILQARRVLDFGPCSDHYSLGFLALTFSSLWPSFWLAWGSPWL